MTDMETTPSPGNAPSADATEQAPTQLIAPETTQLLLLDTTQSIAPDTTPAAVEKTYRRTVRPWFKKKRFALPSAVFVVFVLIMISTGGNDPRIFDFTTSALESQVENAANTPATATIGQSVRDGKFAFIVTSVQPPAKSVTNRLGSTVIAQGEFVVVRVSVTNIGYDARTLSATDQFLISDKNQRYATSAAISSLAGSERIFLEKVNPGQTVNDAPLLFDVAPGTAITGIELHDSTTSAGVKVKLP
jgi:Domain of unknown function (DUF4352)